MKNKLILLTCLFLVLGIITTGSLGYADKVKLINPKNKTVTTNNVILVSGKGKQGTNVKIDAYLANLLRNKKIDLNNPPNGGYALAVSEDVKIGASGSFARELSLANGLNKIEVEVENSPDSQTRYVYITDINRARSELTSVGDMRFTGALRSLIK